MKTWWVREIGGVAEGPLSTDAIVEAIKVGRIGETWEVCAVGSFHWLRAHLVDPFSQYIFVEDETQLTSSPWFESQTSGDQLGGRASTLSKSAPAQSQAAPTPFAPSAPEAPAVSSDGVLTPDLGSPHSVTDPGGAPITAVLPHPHPQQNTHHPTLQSAEIVDVSAQAGVPIESDSSPPDSDASEETMTNVLAHKKVAPFAPAPAVQATLEMTQIEPAIQAGNSPQAASRSQPVSPEQSRPWAPPTTTANQELHHQALAPAPRSDHQSRGNTKVLLIALVLTLIAGVAAVFATWSFGLKP